MQYESTRSSENVDAHRDFDDFDVNEELHLLKIALSVSDTPHSFVKEAFENIDEYLHRGGSLPDTWVR